ncbi:uncharacterized protein LOC143187227 [Calliopsis andreniformis]|uniref:uncharacterized protein LOC143187227 n=1 Tax=Calliopsis andreniformis TaxID=337506 RepID=UPI003FCEC619
MFGTKLRTWMEAHIVRSKKKKERKKGEKGFDSNCNSPRSSSANRSPALHQVHPIDSPSKNVDGIRLHGRDRYGGAGNNGSASATTTTSSATSAGTGSVNLSSPESAYSTGYSTDGTSPGASFPPEYYINIRTGTHYFQNSGNNGRPKRPTDAVDFSAAAALLSGHGNLESAGSPANMTREHQRLRDVRSNASNKIGERAATRESKEPQAYVHEQQYQRRIESLSADSSRSNLAASVPSAIPPPLVSPAVQSPRERSRIRTNPWLSANSSTSSTAGFKSRLNLDDTSSSSGLKLTESSGSASDVNANSSRGGRARNEYKQESLSAGRSPINQNWRIASGMEIRSKMALSIQRRSSSSNSSTTNSTSSSNNSTSSGSSSNISDVSGRSHGPENGNNNDIDNGNGSSASSVTRSGVASSEDDITLNEMMGKFDESYVYEKETDILSDSDPTDCEDYIDSLSDADATRDVVNENVSRENDDFDYIDNGSFLDLDNLDCSARFPNTGHCTYFAFTSELARRSSRLRESLMKRRCKEDATAFQRTASTKNSGKRQSGRQKKPEEKQQSEKRKRRVSQRRKPNLEKCNDETANLNRVLVERMLLKNSGFNQGSRSVGGTPICLRRKKHDLNKNLSPIKLNDNRSIIQPTIVDSDMVKRRSNSISYVNGNIVRRRITGNTYMTTFASEIALIEADKEADKKYRELILEAENILVDMQKSQNNMPIVPSPSRKLHNGLANKRVELIKNTELNIELALSKSRNSQPELQSGSIRDLEHTSPKRQFAQPCSPVRRFMERNGTTTSGFLPKETFYRQEATPIKYSVDSPLATRKTPPQHSPNRSLLRCSRPRRDHPDSCDSNGHGTATTNCNGALRSPDLGVSCQTSLQNRVRSVLPPKNSTAEFNNRKDFRGSRSTTKEEGVTSSSSDSEERCDVRRRAPLMIFRSVDMGPVKEGSSYCPQSEPVKRKVYAGSTTYGRIQKTLGEHIALRNSDGDTTTDDTDDSRRCLKEKVAQLRRERLAAEANMSANVQDSQIFQQQISQLRRQMLMQTIEGLKRSLEDQSATLKQTCFEPVMTEQLP